jgi:teichuronic acid biosynthesis glycosyltransferase TuaC
LNANAVGADRPLRILAVTNLWPVGDDHTGVFVLDLVESVRALGHHVQVEIVAQRNGRADYLLAVPRLRRAFQREPWDVVHLHFGMTALTARLAGIGPRVLTLYGSDVNVRWKHWITRLGSGGIAERIYVSRRLATAAGDPDGLVIPNGVDRRTLTPGDRAVARSELGFEPHERVVLFGANPRRAVKGHDVFRDVLAALVTRGFPVRELVLTEPGQDRVRVARKFDAADVLLFTSVRGSEGSPTVVKEAAAMGLPVVSVELGDVAEILAGVEPSSVVAFPDHADSLVARAALVESLADAVAAVLAEGRRSNGRELTSWLDLPLVAQRVVDVYRRACCGATLA